MRDREVALPVGVVGVGIDQAFGLLSSGLVGREGLPQTATRLGDIADSHASPVAVPVRRKAFFEGQKTPESLLGRREVAGPYGQPAAPQKSLRIVGIERGSLRIRLP